MPKGTDLSIHTQAELDAIADSQNNWPCATNAFHSPLEVFVTMLKARHQPSTINFHPMRLVLRLGLETDSKAGRLKFGQ